MYKYIIIIVMLATMTGSYVQEEEPLSKKEQRKIKREQRKEERLANEERAKELTERMIK